MGLFGKNSVPTKIKNDRKISIKELVGKKYDEYYKAIFEKFDEGNKSNFNIYACIFAPYWLIYKRMTFTGISVIGLQVILSIFAYYLTGPITVGIYISSYILYLLTGVYGEYMYYKKILSNMEFSQQIDDKFKDRFLKDKSGDDIYMTIVWIVGTIIIYLVAYFL